MVDRGRLLKLAALLGMVQCAADKFAAIHQWPSHPLKAPAVSFPRFSLRTHQSQSAQNPFLRSPRFPLSSMYQTQAAQKSSVHSSVLSPVSPQTLPYPLPLGLADIMKATVAAPPNLLRESGRHEHRKPGNEAKKSATQEMKKPATQEVKPDKKPRKSVIPGDPMVIGLSHNTAKVEVREKLSIPESDWDFASKEIRALDNVDEAGVLSTCNRFEVYLVTKSPETAKESVLQYLEGRSGLDRATLMDNLFFDYGKPAVEHLLQVSAGFDSLVVGEGQILSQVRSCHTHGVSKDGSFGTILTKLFNIAIHSGKRVRSETNICKGAVSISSAAVELAIMKSEEKLGKPLKETKVAIVGAGTMSRLAITHLLSHDVTDISIVNRGQERMEQLAEGFPDAHLKLYLLDHLWEQMMQSDVIITSTSSTEPFLTKENLHANWAGRQKPLMIVDISVPRNVETDTNELEQVVAYNVDDLKQVVAANQAKRKDEIEEAKKLLIQEFNTYQSWKESLLCIPAITAILRRGDEIIHDEMDKYDSQLDKLDKKERQMVERIVRNVVNKLLHGPLSELRSQDGSVKIDVASKLALVDNMFRLQLDRGNG